MKTLRWLSGALLVLVAAILLVAASLAVRGYAVLGQKQASRVPALRVRPDSSLIGRGRHLAELSCAACHGVRYGLPLSGGTVNLLATRRRRALGVLYGSNLTPGGRLGEYGDGELSRAIREGVNREARPMLLMPSARMQRLSDRDLAALVAFLRSQPAVPGRPPARRLTGRAYLMLGLRLFDTSVQLPVDLPVADVPGGPTREYGVYLAACLGCTDCHGATLRGGRQGPLTLAGPDLAGSVRAGDAAAFARALREGEGSGGRRLDALTMPWPGFRRLTDTETAAIYAFARRPR